jgi:hypothetical protein
VHRKYISALLVLFILFLVTSCGGQTNIATVKKNEVPEPYRLALEDIKNNNYDSAYRYLELTIKDFPDSNYLSNAYFLKSIIDCNSLYNDVFILNILVQGMENGMVLYKYGNYKEEIQRLDNFADTLANEVSEKKNKFKEEIISVNNAVDNNGIILSDFSINEINYDKREPFDYFKKVGTPVPTESEFTSEKQRYEKVLITNSLNRVIVNNNVDYLKYYYDVLIVSNLVGLDKDFMKQISGRIMTLTENDKYNKIRLDTEEFIKKNNLN